MDHGHPSPAVPRCKVYMLWNTDVIDTCIIFRSWHISTYIGFVLALLAIAFLGILYEFLRVLQRKVDFHIAQCLAAKGKAATRGRDRSNSPNRRDSPGITEGDSEELGLLTGRLAKCHATGTRVPLAFRILRALLYGVTVFLSFFLMLIFMTYNAYYISAVVVGATLGHYIFGATMNTDSILVGQVADRGVACH